MQTRSDKEWLACTPTEGVSPGAPSMSGNPEGPIRQFIPMPGGANSYGNFRLVVKWLGMYCLADLKME